MKKRNIGFCIICTCLLLSSGAIAIQKQPDTSQEEMEINRAWHEHADQNNNAPAPSVGTTQQQDTQKQSLESSNISNTMREGSAADTKAVETAAQDIRDENPVYKTGMTVVKIVVAFVVCLALVWCLWRAIVARQQRKIRENIQKGLKVARDLRDRPEKNSF